MTGHRTVSTCIGTTNHHTLVVVHIPYMILMIVRSKSNVLFHTPIPARLETYPTDNYLTLEWTKKVIIYTLVIRSNQERISYQKQPGSFWYDPNIFQFTSHGKTSPMVPETFRVLFLSRELPVGGPDPTQKGLQTRILRPSPSMAEGVLWF